MRTSTVIQSRILDFVKSNLGVGIYRDGRRRERKLNRGRVRLTLVDFILSKAIDAGIIPPADDADERDWEAFFEALAKFMETIIPLILRLIDAFPAGE